MSQTLHLILEARLSLRTSEASSADYQAVPRRYSQWRWYCPDLRDWLSTFSPAGQTTAGIQKLMVGLQQTKGTMVNCHSPWLVQNAVSLCHCGARSLASSHSSGPRSRLSWLLLSYPGCRWSLVVGSNTYLWCHLASLHSSMYFNISFTSSCFTNESLPGGSRVRWLLPVLMEWETHCLFTANSFCCENLLELWWIPPNSGFLWCSGLASCWTPPVAVVHWALVSSEIGVPDHQSATSM
jgi:hypothetical protein